MNKLVVLSEHTRIFLATECLTNNSPYLMNSFPFTNHL